MNAIERAVPAPELEVVVHRRARRQVLGDSPPLAACAEDVISPFTTSRTFTVRLLPPRLPGRMSGSTWLHSSSVKSLGYRSLLRSYRARFSIVHIGDLSTTQAAPGRLSLHYKCLIPFNMFPNRLLELAGFIVASALGLIVLVWGKGLYAK